MLTRNAFKCTMATTLATTAASQQPRALVVGRSVAAGPSVGGRSCRPSAAAVRRAPPSQCGTGHPARLFPLPSATPRSQSSRLHRRVGGVRGGLQGEGHHAQPISSGGGRLHGGVHNGKTARRSRGSPTTTRAMASSSSSEVPKLKIAVIGAGPCGYLLRPAPYTLHPKP